MNKKNSFLLSFYFFVLYIFTCASTSYLTISEGSGLIISLIPAVLGLLVALKIKVDFLNKNFLLIMGVFILWNIVIYVTLKRMPSPYPFISLFVAYIAYHAFKFDFIERYVDFTVKLGILNLFVWMLCLLAPIPMESFGKAFGIETQNVSYSFIFFNIPIFYDGVSFARNCGNCWEAGRYACMLMFAIYFYFWKNGLNFNNYKVLVLILALLTTFSTTGYAMFLVMLIVWVLYNKKLNPVYLIPLAILVVAVWNLPFMRDKIFELAATEDDAMGSIEAMVYNAQHGKEVFYTPQRLEAIVLQLINLQNMPLLTGEGRNLMYHYINRNFDITISLSEGVFGVFVRYGLILGLLCYYSLFKSSKLFAESSSHKVPKILFMIVFVLANVSYYFWEYPLFTLMWCYFFFSSSEQKKIYSYV